ncbi:hypothetical protein EZS27_000697 [termite gut metagenome]|uniref:Uncharacterized protein n=1 Tax=termite gut metagenome TaxID=433724 RepID=A0A5J4T368_9ZZZZ
MFSRVETRNNCIFVADNLENIVMFDIFKKDVKVGDKVKLYLTTGKEPEGNVIEIGDNFVLLQSNDQTQNRFFDKLIGGWDILRDNDTKSQSLIDVAKKLDIPITTIIQFLAKKGYSINYHPNTKISSECLELLKEKFINSKLLDDSTFDKNSNIKKGVYKLPETKLKKPIVVRDPNSDIENPEEQNILKKIEKSINQLIQNSEFESAISQIDIELKSSHLDNKYKSSLLLKKAQTYSSLNNPTKSEEAYQQLISFNVKTGSPANNLSHLYTELARLQALNPEKQNLALESVNKALKYNPNNNFANNLLNQLQGKSTITKIENIEDEENNLLVDAEDDSTAISKMIDIDIREHKFTNPEILKNAGKPTGFIAKQIFETAKETRDIDLSERYPIYLEAAKAFSELNIGSYDLQEYLESAAYYAMLKGNSLFINFRNSVQNKTINIIELTRLKDSACSYYIESLNLLSNIEPKLLLTILSNYLKLNIVLHKLINNGNADFKGQFADVFFDCVRSKNKELEKIAYQTVVSIGAASTQAWNKLSNISGGTGNLYGLITNEEKKSYIFELINETENTSIDLTLNPSIFLKKSFQQRKDKEKALENVIYKIFEIELEPHNINTLIEKWEATLRFVILFTSTDTETKNKIDELLSILKPYLHRNQTERINLLIQSQKIIEAQIKFINVNTTFYGRTFFFPLLNKWKKEIDNLLGEKIAQSYPSLKIIIDPPYFVNKDGEKIVNVIIKNGGETTAEGFELNIKAESTIYEDTEQNFSLLTEEEIPAGEQVSTNFVVPIELLKDSKAVEIEINAIAIYQKKKIKAKQFSFTIEEEPTKEDRLTYDDIVWNEGQIPEKHLFIGRQQIVNDLAQHYESVERHKSYILYGLTRTGKSSILKYLKENLQGDTFQMKGKEMTLLPFSWDLSQAASFKKASDFWEYALYQQVYETLDIFAQLYSFDFSDLQFPQKPRAKDFPILLNYLKAKNIYPFFLIDEFSFIKTLIDGDIVNAAFLHTLRQYSLDALASFIYAGTYDIKQLISDPKYGITGQLVNAIEEQINEINDEDAEALIEVMKDKLKFTPEAVSHIQTLSGNIPYFIQIICKYCGFYASENNRLYIGYPELEKVIKILTGKEESNSNSLVKNLPENIFQNNQFSPADPKEVNVLISSIVHFNRDKINNPRGVGFDELQRLWAEKRVEAFRPKLAESINLLKDKKILIQEEDEGMPVYKFAVDLFRRWWTVHHSDIDLEISTII